MKSCNEYEVDMLSSNDTNNEYFLGIDGGGSKCKAVVVAYDSDNQNHKIIGT